MIRKLLREPVLHFVLIGVALFVLYGKVAAPDRTGTRVVVSQAAVDNLAREFQARWFRPPSAEELTGLVDSYVRDEILYREGVAQGLDRDDPVIKRRVRQKLEVIAEEQIARDAPGDAELAAYLAKHAARFARPGAASFEQIFFPESASAQDIAAARAQAARGMDPARLGKATMLPPRVDDLRMDLVARDFGAEFAAAIEKLPLNEWTGPVRSGFGQHLVRLSARTPAAAPKLEDVRAAVAREWEAERRSASLAESYKRLRAKYEIVIEATEPSPVATR